MKYKKKFRRSGGRKSYKRGKGRKTYSNKTVVRGRGGVIIR